MTRPTNTPSALARQQIERDISHALTLPPHQQQSFLTGYLDTISSLADKCPDPDTAYNVLSNHADDTYERLIEEAEPS
ncbi:hypothetical protein ACFYY1_39080 [Streptomyces sp. NPDC001890]|uniref:hypothetical protein n=1 Tax=Streptomyces sp. NPDC001890 TaxID=3364620 RepID=UPI0036CDF377